MDAEKLLRRIEILEDTLTDLLIIIDRAKREGNIDYLDASEDAGKWWYETTDRAMSVLEEKV